MHMNAHERCWQPRTGLRVLETGTKPRPCWHEARASGPRFSNRNWPHRVPRPLPLGQASPFDSFFQGALSSACQDHIHCARMSAVRSHTVSSVFLVVAPLDSLQPGDQGHLQQPAKVSRPSPQNLQEMPPTFFLVKLPSICRVCGNSDSEDRRSQKYKPSRQTQQAMTKDVLSCYKRGGRLGAHHVGLDAAIIMEELKRAGLDHMIDQWMMV